MRFMILMVDGGDERSRHRRHSFRRQRHVLPAMLFANENDDLVDLMIGRAHLIDNTTC